MIFNINLLAFDYKEMYPYDEIVIDYCFKYAYNYIVNYNSRNTIMSKKKRTYYNQSANNRMMQRLRKFVKALRYVSITLVCVLLSVGTVAFFIVSVATDNATIDSLNGFVGIVLGVVALTASIVSMFLSFYSIEKSEESDKEMNIILTEIKAIDSNIQSVVSKIEEKQQELNNNVQRSISGSNTPTREQEIKAELQWQTEDDNEIN